MQTEEFAAELLAALQLIALQSISSGRTKEETEKLMREAIVRRLHEIAQTPKGGDSDDQ